MSCGETLYRDLAGIGLAHWQQAIAPLVDERLSGSGHGRYDEWRAIVDGLPTHGEDASRDTVRRLLLGLSPWRKGPFELHGVRVNAEWRSDLKWARLAGQVTPLANRNVLDVGCGNGYYALRMLEAGARLVVGIDPTILFVLQFAAVKKLSGIRDAHVLPLRLEDLPGDSAVFDTTFSMGVLYHRRDPVRHLEELRETLRPGGELVLETLVLPGEGDLVLTPEDRYARMRNVWHLPSIPALCGWLVKAGFPDARVVDVTTTSTKEQRATAWMTFESLADALDPDDPARTVEGLPAPTRAVLIARRP